VLLLNESCPHDNNVSCFMQKHSVAKLLPTRYVINVLPRHNLLNVSYGFPCQFIYTNKIYLYGARSGFEPESPVHIRIWTCRAGNNSVFCKTWEGKIPILATLRYSLIFLVIWKSETTIGRKGRNFKAMRKFSNPFYIRSSVTVNDFVQFVTYKSKVSQRRHVPNSEPAISTFCL